MQAVGRLFTGTGREDVDGTAAVVGTLEETFILQVGDVLMDRGQGAKAEAAGDLFVRRGVAILLSKVGEKVDDLFLPPRDSHAGIVANKKRIARGFLDCPALSGVCERSSILGRSYAKVGEGIETTELYGSKVRNTSDLRIANERRARVVLCGNWNACPNCRRRC